MYKKLIITALLFFIGAGALQAAPELLKPDQAFLISARTGDNKTLQVSWQIAEGYYLYQSKFRFIPDNAGVEFGEADYPEGISKTDPFFGELQIYRNQVTLDIPLEKVPDSMDMLTLKARSQGCADIGICFPPHNQTVLVALKQSADEPPPVDMSVVEEFNPTGSGETHEAAADPLQALAALGDELGLDDQEDGILPPEQAFRFSAEALDGKHLKLHWDIADGTYLYQDKVKISISANGIQLGEYPMPQPDIKKNSIKPDGNIGDVAVYHHAIDIKIPLVRATTDASEITVNVGYQGCADRGICYPPQKTSLKLALTEIDKLDSNPAAETPASSSSTAVSSMPQAQSEQDQIASMIAGESTWMVIGAFFLIGLGLAFTPCVFPMIPILSGIITGHGKDMTTGKAFSLSVVYVLAMAVTYTAAGVFAAMAGENIQALLQNPIALSAFALVFVALAFSMFGFYDLQLPSSLQTKLTEISNRQEGGHLTGAAIMGLLSALIVGPCVAPPLAGALIYIGQTGDAVLGGLALFAMSMGMGAPLVVIGTSAGKLLPRAGAWMDAVKAVFGVIMLGMAIYLLERVISETAAMFLWGALLVISSIYMGALNSLPEAASGWRKLWKGSGLILLIYGALFLVGVAANGHDTLQPLRGIMGTTGGSSQTGHVAFKRIKSVADLEREVATAKAAGKPVMLDFYADWCTYCKVLEKDVFPHPKVRSALTGFVLLQADITEQDEQDKALQNRFSIPAPPALIFWDAQGQELNNYRLMGNKTADDLAAHIAKAMQ